MRYEDLVGGLAFVAGMRPQPTKAYRLWSVELDLFVWEAEGVEGAYCGKIPDNDNSLKAIMDGLKLYVGEDRRFADVSARKWATLDKRREGVGVRVTFLGEHGAQPTDPAVVARRDSWLPHRR